VSPGPAEVAVIGGSGFYSFLTDRRELTVSTPYGDPSGPIALGSVGDRAVAFLSRHGPRHEIPPHGVNYRANLWALRSLGATRVIAPTAVGSLRPDLHPGDLVVLDQLVDRTSGRADTYLDGPDVDHVGFADPYCPELSALLTRVGSTREGARLRAGGTVVVIQGPRFSTRAESRWFRAAGWDVVNMTQYPEAALARELGLCYAGLALVTDYDTGVEGEPSPGGEAVSDAPAEPVTMAAVLAVLADNVQRTRELLFEVIPKVPATRACGCAAAGSAFLRG
jgi:5'-methylthioadenosine phosphorylase